jgi:signal transduction histidine kinase
VAVDFNRFSQVLRNIISNALKFTSPGGVIDVRVTEQTAALTSESILNFDQARFPKEDTHTDYIRIDISDTGSGMTKTQQESLFRGPVQFADSSAANANGAGLGLWSK